MSDYPSPDDFPIEVTYITETDDGMQIGIRLKPKPEVVEFDVTAPAWRLAVDLATSLMEGPQGDLDGFTEDDVALWNCFDLLRDLVAPEGDDELASLLARFVAVCESRCIALYDSVIDETPDHGPYDVQSLGRLFTSPPSSPWWYRAGQYAASWLRSVTEDAS